MMKKYIILLILIVLGSISFAQNKINGYEYWFDGDYDNKTTSLISPVASHSLNTAIPTIGLPDGLHTFNIRFSDESGLWSSTLSQFFYKAPAASTIDRKITQYEYWYDGDYANKTVSTVALTDNLNLNTLISTSSLPNGLHTYNIRFMDDTGLWSSTLSQFFYKAPAASAIDRKITQYEYWYDGDYANKTVSTVALTDNLNLNTLIPASTLPNGLHTYNIRFMDDSGLWSSTLSQFFYKMSQQAVADKKITTYRYWLDDDFSNAIVQDLTVPVKNLNLINDIDLSQIPKGFHTINFQFKDSIGLWSVVSTDTIEKLSLPVADFNNSTVSSCDSTTYYFVNTSLDGDVYNWDFGDGTTDSTMNPSHTYYTPGNYTIMLTARDTNTTQDSTKQIQIFVAGKTYSTINPTVCNSYTSPSTSHTWTNSGIYHDTIPNHMACDSIITIDLTVNHSSASSIEATSCYSYMAPDGQVYTSSGIKTAVISNSEGCDSTITINLSINTVDVTVAQEVDQLTALSTQASYQWLDCNNGYSSLPNETSQIFVPTANGSYAVQCVQNGCIDTSSCYTFTNVSIEERKSEADLVVYPNPFNDNIYFSTTENVLRVVLTNISGQIIIEKNVAEEKWINTKSLSRGVYFIIFERDNKEKVVYKMVK